MENVGGCVVLIFFIPCLVGMASSTTLINLCYSLACKGCKTSENVILDKTLGPVWLIGQADMIGQQ